MKKIFTSAIMLLFFITLVFASKIDGKWRGAVETNEGPYYFTVTYTVVGDSLYGRFTSDYGDLDFNGGKVNGDEFDASFGAHFGLFRSFDNRTIFGIGAEYKSGQGGPYFSDRLTEGEVATSLFFGTMIGKNFYIQNEFAKGLANSRDFGFATTFKFLFDFNR